MSDPLPPPPGWYPDPEAPGLRWWDGMRWTEHRSAPAPPAPVTYLPPTAPAARVPELPKQKWWHIPLLVVLGVISVVGSVVVQLVAR